MCPASWLYPLFMLTADTWESWSPLSRAWLKYGLLLSDGRIVRAKITNSFSFIAACVAHVGFFSLIWLLSDLFSSLHFWSNIKRKVFVCRGNQEQSRCRLNKDYGNLFILSFCSFLSGPFLYVSDLCFEPEGRCWWAQHFSLLHLPASDTLQFIHLDTLLIMSLEKAVRVSICMIKPDIKEFQLLAPSSEKTNDTFIWKQFLLFSIIAICALHFN